MFLKRDELSSRWEFPSGVRVLKNISAPLFLDVAPFRENTDYASIFESISKKYYPSLKNRYDDDAVDSIKQSWDVHMHALTDLDTSGCKKMDIRSLKNELAKSVVDCSPAVMKDLENNNDKVSLKATFYDLDESEGIVGDLEKDDSVVIYTKIINSRPWLGLFIQRPDEFTVEIQWLKRFKTTYVPHLNKDGSHYISSVPSDAIMFSNILENTSPSRSRDGPYKLSANIKRQVFDAYQERDNSI